MHGNSHFDRQDSTATEGSGRARERERASKLAWAEERVEFHWKHWKAFETQFIQHYVQRASRVCNMASDEHLAGGVGAGERVAQV
jgi:hypothetical protein